MTLFPLAFMAMQISVEYENGGFLSPFFLYCSALSRPERKENETLNQKCRTLVLIVRKIEIKVTLRRFQARSSAAFAQNNRMSKCMIKHGFVEFESLQKFRNIEIEKKLDHAIS